jgi:hypothetical protein
MVHNERIVTHPMMNVILRMRQFGPANSLTLPDKILTVTGKWLRLGLNNAMKIRREFAENRLEFHLFWPI